MSGVAIFTIASKNYLAYARTLMDSVAAHQPDADRFVLLVDRIDGCFDPSKENFKVVEIEDLDIPAKESFFFKYDITELNTATKPFFLEYLFAEFGYDKVIYFDPDILLIRGLGDLFGLLDRHSIVLTPHLTSPLPDDGKQHSEVDIMRVGCFNLGFIGLSRHEQVKPFLSWWKDRLGKYCYSAPERGLFVDQKWVDLVPSYFDGVHILKHPGYNAAYWNLHERRFEECKDGFLVNGLPLFFFHFSGIRLDNLDVVSKYQNRFTLKDIPQLRPLFRLYKERIFEAGYESVRRWPYAFGAFDNGIQIPGIVRRFYAGIKDSGSFENPFATSRSECFLDSLVAPASSSLRIPNILLYIYEGRTELQRAFPMFASNPEPLFLWAKSELPRQYGFSADFMSLLKFDGPERQRMQPAPTVGTLPKRPPVKEALWEFGMRHASKIKSVPVLRTIAEKTFWRLAGEMAPASLPPSPFPGGPAMVAAGVSPRKGTDEPGVNLAGYIDTESGVGEAARGMVRSLQQSGLSYVLNNIEQQWLRRNDRTHIEFSKDNPYAVNLLHVNADQVPAVFDQMGEGYFKGKYNIGYWFWELSDFPERWRSAFSYFDEIWVASDFLLDAISRVSPIPVVKIPIPVEFSPPEQFTRSDLNIADDTFIFLNIFDCRSFIERKNPFALLEAFRIAFRDLDCRNSVLILKMTNTDENPQFMAALRGKGADLPVLMIDEYYDRGHVNDLLALSDCYVSLHRAEGFGLPMAEAMYLGKPVIATAYSGNLDFMNVNNSYLIKYDLVEIGNDVGPYPKGSLWADAHTEHAAEMMSATYHKRDEAFQKGQRASEYVKTMFAPERCGKLAEGRLSWALGGRKPAGAPRS